MRYLSHRLRVAQPPTFRGFNHVACSQLQLAAAVAIFADGTTVLGNQALYAPGRATQEYTTKSRIGTAFTTVRQYGGMWMTTPIFDGQLPRGRSIESRSTFTYICACQGVDYTAIGGTNARPWLMGASGNGSNNGITLGSADSPNRTYVMASQSQNYDPQYCQVLLDVGWVGNVIITFNSGVWAAYLNGIPTTPYATVTPRTYGPGGDDFGARAISSSFFGWWDSNQYAISTGQNFGAILNRALTPAEVKEYANNIWQVFA